MSDPSSSAARGSKALDPRSPPSSSRVRLAAVRRPTPRPSRLWWRWLGGAGLVLLGAGGTAALMAPGYVRRKAVEKARARGIELVVGSVKLGWNRIVLRDVQGQLEGVSSVSGSAREVSVPWALAGAGDPTVTGAQLTIDGAIDDVRADVEAWRARHPSAGSEPSGRARTLRLHDARVTWRIAGIELANGFAADAQLEGGRIAVQGAGGALHFGAIEVRSAGISGEYTRSTGLLGSLSVGQLGVVFGGGAAAPELPPPVMPMTTAAKPVEQAAADRVWGGLERVRGLLEKARAHFDSGVELHVTELTVESDRGKLGPWGAHVLLGADATSFELVPTEADGRKPLALHALVPREKGKWIAEMKLGPATLAEIGVQEGAFGLVEVAKTTAEAKGSLELDPDEKSFVADGSIQVKGGAFADPRIADGVVTGIELGLRGVVTSKGDLRSWTLSGGRFELGKLALEVDGAIERGAADAKGVSPTRFAAHWSMPTLMCSDALASLPTGLVPNLVGMTMTGTFGAHGSVAFDTTNVEKTALEFFVDQHCKITGAPESLAVARFRKPFDLRIYDPKGLPGEIRQFGPGTPTWTSMSNISPYVEAALLTCEDGAFFSHNGFSPMAIRNAIIANLKAGKFALGASTITMQLAKNVYLDRRKQLSRKVQEAVLTAWLEQSLSKDEILELYLNVIEFGPNLYGIGPAAWHYFGRPASDLDPMEALFLVSILPAPVRRSGMWAAGAPGDGYMEYLRTLLREENRRGKIDDQELEEALAHPLVFHKPGMPNPEPHAFSKSPAGILKIGSEEGSSDYDPAWAPLQ
jgi:hypothetical protein